MDGAEVKEVEQARWLMPGNGGGGLFGGGSSAPKFMIQDLPVTDENRAASQSGNFSMFSAWSRRLPEKANGVGCAVQHTVQSKGKEFPDDIYADPLIADGEVCEFTFTLLRGTGTFMRVGVAAADDSGRTWGIRLNDGSLALEPTPPPKLRDRTYFNAKSAGGLEEEEEPSRKPQKLKTGGSIEIVELHAGQMRIGVSSLGARIVYVDTPELVGFSTYEISEDGKTMKNTITSRNGISFTMAFVPAEAPTGWFS